MDVSSILLAVVAFLTTTAIFVILFERLGFGAILGFIIAGIVIGPHTPGPVPIRAVEELQSVAEIGVVLFLAIITATWAIDHAGISMTLGAFLLGMLLSASDFRYQIEATVAPFKQTLMGLIFIAVGMSIGVGALAQDWQALLVHVPVVLAIKAVVLIGLVLAVGSSRPAAIRTGFYLSKVGEFAFLLLGAATVAGLLSADGHTLAMLVVAVSMIATPLLVKTGGRLAGRLAAAHPGAEIAPAAKLDRHVVIVGFEEVGQLI